MDIINSKIQFYSLYLNIDNIKLILFNRNDIDKIIEEIHTNTYDIYSRLQQTYISFMSLSYEDKVSNNYSNILLCELLYKFCIMIYTNKKIIDDIIEFNSLLSNNTRRKSKKYDLIETKFFNYINMIKKNLYYIENINTYDKYVKYLIALFNYDIFGTKYIIIDILPRDTIIAIKPTELEIFKFNFGTYDINSFKTNENISKFIKLLLNVINTQLYIKAGMSYITLPQYEGICWFISMLCGITYSDMSKNLLIKKRTRRISASANTFKKFAYDIIDNITRDFKKYNTTTIYSDCELLIALKFTPLNVFRDILDAEVRSKDKDYYMKILYKLCSEIDDNEIENQQTKSSIIFDNIYNKKINTIDNICIGILLEEIFKTDFIFKTVLDKTPYKESYTIEQKKRIIALHIYNNILVKFLEKGLISLLPKYDFNNYGISFNQNNILSHLYDLLNISNNYYYCYKEAKDKELQIRIKTGFIVKPNPDVIIIENCKYEDAQLLDLDSSIKEEIIIQEEITYNGNKYKLDYILHLSNDNYTCESCGHCISAIHYENKEYIYDSKFHNYMINCRSSSGVDNNIYIPCPLLEEKWSEKLNSETCYRVEKCGIINTNKSSISRNEIDKFRNICYTYDENIIYVYIKN